MKHILITGAGGREHALGVAIKQHHPETQLFFCKGNGGTQTLGENIDLSSVEELAQFAEQKNIALTIVGSEDLLVQGMVDEFQKRKLPIFGPHQEAAMLEGSKAFAKAFMQTYGIKTATHTTCTSLPAAVEVIRKNNTYPLVIKASGLAAGKGVFIVSSEKEALHTVEQLMTHKRFGASGETVVIEEYLEGFEVSVLSLYNHNRIYPLLPAKDHKQLLDGNQGPNTGGMGVIAPHPLVDASWWATFERDILHPTEKGLQASKLSFAGVIFFGLMTTKRGIYLLEYNMRFGDPETQAILPLLESDLLQHLEDAIAQKPLDLKWKGEHSCCVVLASKGYPQHYEQGKKIGGLNEAPFRYFVAGATMKEQDLYTAGGRVLNVLGTGKTQEEARQQAYHHLSNIRFDGMYYRKDIGQ